MIGFKTQQLATIKQQEPADDFDFDVDVKQLLHMRGMTEALEIVREYMHGWYPLLTQERKDQMLAERLRKIKERYFDKI